MAVDPPVIEIVPLAEVPPTLLRRLIRPIEERFPGRIAQVARQPLPLPPLTFVVARQQYRADLLLDLLARPPGAAERVLGVANLDLFVPGMNFVFGLAQTGGPAIIGLARLRPEFYGEPPNPRRLEARAIKEAVHELGHTYGLQHCPIPTCVMHFSNTLADTDRKSDRFCPAHEAQLRQALAGAA